METNTQLQIVKQMPLPELQEISKTFFDSGLFKDVKSAAATMVCIMAGQEVGIPPFAAISGISIIMGKPTIGAGLIASRIKGSGKYDYKVVTLSESICSLDFYQGSEKLGNSTFTIEDAKKAGTQNIQKFPKNMLFARAISNGVKWFCPDVFAGPVYVPEEMPAQETIDVQHEEVKTPVIDTIIAKDTLESCTTLKELADAFKALPKDVAKEVVDIKDELKAKLTSQSAVPIVPTDTKPTMLVQPTNNPLPNDFNPTAL
jgi:hypothetical protein